jgi:glycerophosphoryl diester phosphodiesterase
MKLIAHRGWAQGHGENTLAAFARAAGEPGIDGVEFDVRRAAGGSLVVAHDPPRAAGTLTLDAALAFLAPTRLELLVEIKEPGLAAPVIEALVARKLYDRALVFAFVPVARSFPWTGARPVRLGAIVQYPWNLRRVARAYAPDVLSLGWDAREWTRRAFRAWWSVFSLERTARDLGVAIVAGIAQRTDDLDWLARQNIYAAVADMGADDGGRMTADR